MSLEREYTTFIEALRKESAERLHSSAMRWNELANNRSSQISSQLFTIAALIIPLSFFPISNDELLKQMNLYGKISLAGAWAVFILSLIAGLLHLRRESKFFNDWAEQENKRSKIYSEGIFATSAVRAFKRLEEMNKTSIKLMGMPSKPSAFFLYTQQILLIIGIALVGFVLGTIMFSH